MASKEIDWKRWLDYCYKIGLNQGYKHQHVEDAAATAIMYAYKAYKKTGFKPTKSYLRKVVLGNSWQEMMGQGRNGSMKTNFELLTRGSTEMEDWDQRDQEAMEKMVHWDKRADDLPEKLKDVRKLAEEHLVDKEHASLLAGWACGMLDYEDVSEIVRELRRNPSLIKGNEDEEPKSYQGLLSNWHDQAEIMSNMGHDATFIGQELGVKPNTVRAALYRRRKKNAN